MGLLEQLSMPAEWVANRRHSIGGSDANIIMGVDVDAFSAPWRPVGEDAPTDGKAERLLRLWREKTGQEAPEDLSGKLFVMMGLFSEPLNAAWFSKNTGFEVAGVGRQHVSPHTPWRTCTLDGVVVENGSPAGIWEAKHVNSFRRDEEILDGYMPQLHHNMAVTGHRTAWLSVLKGNGDWFMARVEYDDAYGDAVRDAEEGFWHCVQTGEPPIPMPEVKPPRPPGWKEYDLSQSNTWATNAPLWLSLAPQQKLFKSVVDDLKSAIPEDAKICTGHGVRASIDKRGAVRFTAMEATNESAINQ